MLRIITREVMKLVVTQQFQNFKSSGAFLDACVISAKLISGPKRCFNCHLRKYIFSALMVKIFGTEVRVGLWWQVRDELQNVES